jgi:hypothetical protein
VGEELLAQRLAELPDTFRLLRDRRIPRTRANIDHIVIGPSGVWGIDAKRYKGKRPALHVDGGIIRPRTEMLRVGGRDRTKLVDGVRTQVARVHAALRDDAVPSLARSALWRLTGLCSGGAFTVGGVHVTWPPRLITVLTDSPKHPVDVDKLSSTLAKASRSG